MNETKVKLPYQTGLAERLSYGLFFTGQGFIYAMIAQYLMFYYTEYALIDVAIVTAIMTVSKVWDAINDTLFGMIVDKVKFKSGKRFLPWLNFTTLLLPFGTILLFAIPPTWPGAAKVTMAVATYLIWDLLYTMCDVPIFSLATAMTSNIQERSLMFTITGVGGAFATAITSVFLVKVFNNYGFLKTAMLVAAISLVAMRPVSHLAKERHKVKLQEEQSSSFKEMWLYLKGNKYYRYFIAYRLISGSFFISVLPYFTKYCLNDVEFVSVIMGFAIPPTLVLYLIAPSLMKRFDKIKIYRFCMFIFMGSYLTLFIVGYEIKWLLVILFVLALDSAILPSILMGAIPADCVEYGHYATGVRKEGITFALQTFTSKFCASMAIAIAGLLLILIKHDGEAAAMTLEQQRGLFIGMTWLPIIGQSLGLPFLFMYKLRDRDVQVMADANSGKISREEAEKLMSRHY
ncbi:MAG TPA: glycoside-pentoside-hexuronide (GPH):cation symporter [Clostridiales bacterium]|nr:glycoside-pentoside-hexuronide (GPH):cation symporter [Clostridiales bacterium]HRT82113.1 glycoside-pentoside-hexuronide (GPH):cation symporter [Oscillospiraceae bacterium]